MGQDWITTYPEFCPEQNKRLHDRFSPTLYPGTPCPVRRLLVQSGDSLSSPANKRGPRGLKNYDVGGVGLGLVAALEKSGDSGCENKAVFGQNLTRSNPVPVKHGNTNNCGRNRVVMEDLEMDRLEDYTFVTCHGPNKSCTTRVYCDGGPYGHDRTRFERRSKNRGFALFDISPARFGEETTPYPASDFLSSCHLCQKKLHGKDIYMYRGEKAFCSTECRYRQIVMDERKEQCSSEASRSADVSNSPAAYSNGHIFSTGILAT